MTVSTIFAEALSCHHEGRLIDAENLYKQVLAAQPEHPDALHNMGVLQMQCSNPAAAVPWFQAALDAHPENPQCWLSLGEALLANGQADQARLLILAGREAGLSGTEVDLLEAHILPIWLSKPDVAGLQALLAAGELGPLETALEQQLASFGEQPVLVGLMADMLLAQGRTADALPWLQKRCADPSAGVTQWLALGSAFQRLGRTEEAYSAYLKALAPQPGNADILQCLGVNLEQAGYVEEAWVWLGLSVLVSTAQWAHWDVLNAFCEQQGLNQDARAAYASARKLDNAPRGEDAGRLFAILQAGLVRPPLNCRRRQARAPSSSMRNEVLGLVRAGQVQRMLEAGRLLSESYPLDPFGWNVLGVALKLAKEYVQSFTALRLSAAASPDEVEPHNNLAAVLIANDSFVSAELAARRALLIDEKSAKAHELLGRALLGLAQTKEAVEHLMRALKLEPSLNAARSTLLFWMSFSDQFSPEQLREESRRFSRHTQVKRSLRYRDWSCDWAPSKLRVGFISGDLRRHTVGQFSRGLFEELNSNRVELYAYSTNPTVDDLTEIIRPFFKQWRQVDEVTDDAALASLIHEDGLHILVDMSGHTAFNRLPALAYKPAPVQATWLGYSGTTGLPQIDYYIGDPWITPVRDDAHFTERVWRLPETLICLKQVDTGGVGVIPCGPLPASKNGYITFGSFNKLSKISDSVVAVWAAIMRAVPSSRLLLNAYELFYRRNRDDIVDRFSVYGIDSSRLILRDWNRTRLEHLSMYQEVDFSLDPFPYGGATTSIEGIWMGVPVLTLKGDRMVARLGEGINQNAGLQDWIAENTEDYIRRGIRFAEDVSMLESLRKRLRGQVESSSLFDTKRFAGSFERALWGMWSQFEAGRRLMR